MSNEQLVKYSIAVGGNLVNVIGFTLNSLLTRDFTGLNSVVLASAFGLSIGMAAGRMSKDQGQRSRLEATLAYALIGVDFVIKSYLQQTIPDVNMINITSGFLQEYRV